MSDKLIRVYQKLSSEKVKAHTIIYGDLSASCSKCKAINIKLNMPSCPECETVFEFVSFRTVKTSLPKLAKVHAERPSLQIIDYEDYKRVVDVSKVDDFFK